MNRYLLYLLLVNMLTNIVVYVPKILIDYKYDGAVSAILIAIPIGLFLCIVFCKSISAFPEQGLPEILDQLLNRKIKNIILFIFSGFWYFAGFLTLIGFTDIINRFINPEMSKVSLAVLFAIATCFIIQLPTEKVMYIVEIILVLNVPFVFFIVFKALTNEYFSWNSVFEVGTHLFSWPSFKALSAATYTFSGYMNVLIMNRLFRQKIKGINFIVIGFLSIFNMFTTFFIPIGFHGADGAQEYLYPWTTTADCLRIPYGPIERVIFLFLMLYIGITVVSAAIHWHVAFEFLKGASSKKFTKKKALLILIIFSCATIISEMKITAVQTMFLSTYWLILRFIFEICVVTFVFFLARRKKNET
ncbi:MAG: GerAB/ArcD/ProY family transporter [Bacillota bacterium]|nr:GerAB/ArcD/ProY family transporter [Bacillota bacterium]